jgi:hypothetical protein
VAVKSDRPASAEPFPPSEQLGPVQASFREVECDRPRRARVHPDGESRRDGAGSGTRNADGKQADAERSREGSRENRRPSRPLHLGLEPAARLPTGAPGAGHSASVHGPWCWTRGGCGARERGRSAFSAPTSSNPISAWFRASTAPAINAASAVTGSALAGSPSGDSATARRGCGGTKSRSLAPRDASPARRPRFRVRNPTRGSAGLRAGCLVERDGTVFEPTGREEPGARWGRRGGAG